MIILGLLFMTSLLSPIQWLIIGFYMRFHDMKRLCTPFWPNSWFPHLASYFCSFTVNFVKNLNKLRKTSRKDCQSKSPLIKVTVTIARIVVVILLLHKSSIPTVYFDLSFLFCCACVFIVILPYNRNPRRIVTISYWERRHRHRCWGICHGSN